MKALFINSVCGIRSTGRICTDLAQELEKQGYECKIAYGREEYVPEEYKKYAVRIGSNISVRLNALSTRIFDNDGFTAKQATKKFLKWADEYNPDLLWLHNLHGYYINVELLFNWIKTRPNMQVKWTLHDCWAFTGHCTHFTYVKCNKWKNHCVKCPQSKEYPKSLLFSNSSKNYEKKIKLFNGVTDLTIITPSYWLKNLVKESFLKNYKIEVIHNEIDRNVFKPTPSNFRKKYGLTDKYIILGVASVWSDRKGFNDFLNLAKILDDKFVIVLVGLRPKQIKNLPKNILGIERTNNVYELVRIYSAANIYVNPSREETFSMTTAEAQACGVPAIVYKNTACEELIESNQQSTAVKMNYIYLKKSILKILNKQSIS